MKPVALWIALTISSGGIEQVDVGGAVLVEARIPRVAGVPSYETAITLGPLIISDPGLIEDRPDVLGHELQHVRQWEALGPGLALGYLLGGGREFEDYRGDGTMWDSRERRCPVLRWQDGLQFMPCYRF